MVACTTLHPAVTSAGTGAPCVLGVTDTSINGTVHSACVRGGDVEPAGVPFIVPTKFPSGSGVWGSTADVTIIHGVDLPAGCSSRTP